MSIEGDKQIDPLSQALNLANQYGGISLIPPDELAALGYVHIGPGRIAPLSVTLDTASLSPSPADELDQPDHQRSLVWPDHTAEISAALERLGREEGLLFRSVTHEMQNDQIVFDQDGVPQLKEDRISTRAYIQGGWNKVQSLIKRAGNRDTLLSRSEIGTIPAPLTWTSTDPFVCLPYQPGHESPERDQVLLVMKPSPSRVQLVEPDQFEDISDDEGDSPYMDSKELQRVYQQLTAAVQAKQPFSMQLYRAIKYIPGVDNNFADEFPEVVLGPYIERSEIELMVRIRKEHSNSFQEVMVRSFPNHA